ncbi:MAG: MFS transporter, partial [Lentisphaerae bacterium]|nr:MFS transporter [Lentisphaerota bacterium]
AFVGVLAAPGLFDTSRGRIGWIIGVLVVHNVLTHLADPLWFSWMSDFVPEQGFNQHWARRQRVIRLGAILAQIAVALWFGRYEASGQVIKGFVLLGIFGLVLGIVDIAMFAAVPEPEHDSDHDVDFRVALAEPIRDASFRAFLVFRAYWMFAIMVSAPFFVVYLIREVGLSARTVQLLMVVHGLGVVLFSGIWGRICDAHGYRPVLQFVVMFKFVVPLTYVLVPPVPHIAVPVLAGMFFFDGLLNAAGILALQGVTMRSTPRRNRAMYVASSNFVARGIAGGLAPLIAGALIEPLTGVMSCDFGVYHFTGFHVIFLISSVLRGSGLILVNRLKEPDSGTLADVLSQLSPIGFLGSRLPQR